MRPDSIYHAIVAKQAGAWSAIPRWALTAAALPYALAVARRNHRYDSTPSAVTRLDAPVVSVGNLTVGGTGKTPLVIDIAQRLAARNKRPAVVARGYGARRGQVPDELSLIARRVPDAICVANPDRVDGARTALGLGADVIILDDGFQHRRLARDLDIVVIDATNPFGYDHHLPRGLLREPVDQLLRADLIVISRSDVIAPRHVQTLSLRLRSLAPNAPIVITRHRPTGLRQLDGQPAVESPRRAAIFAGIGNPTAFTETVRQMGIEPVITRFFPDHHLYTTLELTSLARRFASSSADAVLTTEKDAVKLLELLSPQSPNPFDPAPLLIVPIDVELLDNGQAILDRALRDLLE